MTDTILSPYTDGTTHTASVAGNNPTALSGVPGRPGPLYIYNPGTVTVRVKIGGTDVVASGTSFPIPAGQLQPINTGAATHIAAWVASGTQAIELFKLGGV